MIKKLLVTGIAAAAVTAGAAAGLTALAGPANAPQVQTVVRGIPMPQAPAPDLTPALTRTLTGLAGSGSFASKKSYIQGGMGRIETSVADAKYNQKAAEGYFPLTFDVADVDQNGDSATANVTATAATGATASMPLTFVEGPSPSGWQLSKESVGALLSALN
ncbi:MAG: hypothetical protein U0R77_10945 [Mycolicibacterium insubricum]|nr:hypothetical protein [Mycobacterium sp.]